MTFAELREGARVRVGPVEFAVEAVDASGALLASFGHWSKLFVHPSGVISDVTGARAGDSIID